MPDIEALDVFSIDPMPAIQTHKFAKSIIRSLLSADYAVLLASACPIQSYPIGRKIFFGIRRIKIFEAAGYLVPFINIPVLKHVTRFIFAGIILIGYVFRYRPKYILIHGVHSPFLLIGAVSGLFGLKVVPIVTDPAGVILPSDGLFLSLLKILDRIFVRFLLRRFDGVISLSRNININYGLTQDSLVIPGIASSDAVINKSDLPVSNRDDIFTITYAGGLSKAYGVVMLVEAVLSISEIPLRLKIYGAGDQVDYLKSISHDDHRIYYGGFLDSDRLREEYIKTDIFINPRPSTDFFSMNSFPSKLLEYLLVGKPVVTTKIASIPEVLDDCFYYIHTESIEGIKAAILNVSNIDKNKLSADAEKSKNIALSEFGEVPTGVKIFDLLNRI